MYRRILKTVGWICLSALVILTTIVLIALGRGYSYDFHTGRLKLNGLVIFSSTPSGADISVNGKQIKHKTPYRSTLETGDYTFEITKPGYQTWAKRISIEASEVTWAQYVLLIPDHLTRSSWASTKSGLSLLANSQDHHHFAYVDSSDGAVWVLDTSSKNPSKLYTPTAPADGQPVETVTALAWSGDASRLLVTTQSGGKTFQRLVDVPSGSVSKLTEQYGFDLTGLQFNPTNSKQLFWLAPEGLRRIDTDSQSVSAVLVDNVVAYAFAGNNQIIYVQTTTLGKSISGMDTSGNDKHELVQSVVDSPSYILDYSSYRGADMLAVLPSTSRTLTLYNQITTDNPVATVITKSADDLKFGPDGRFLNYRDGNRLSTYDLELKRTYNFGVSKTAYQFVAWFDTYHLLVANGTSLSLVEYDGSNSSELSNHFIPGQISYTSNQHEVLVAEPGTGSSVQLDAITIKP